MTSLLGRSRYVISMAIRTVCFVAAVLVGDGWLRWVLIVAALLLPYVAVVMANAASSKSDGFALLDGASGYRELPPTVRNPKARQRPIGHLTSACAVEESRRAN